jgi:hypothetical protein
VYRLTAVLATDGTLETIKFHEVFHDGKRIEFVTSNFYSPNPENIWHGTAMASSSYANIYYSTVLIDTFDKNCDPIWGRMIRIKSGDTQNGYHGPVAFHHDGSILLSQYDQQDQFAGYSMKLPSNGNFALPRDMFSDAVEFIEVFRPYDDVAASVYGSVVSSPNALIGTVTSATFAAPVQNAWTTGEYNKLNLYEAYLELRSDTTVYTVPDRNDFPFSLEFDLPDPWPSGYPAGVSGPIIGYLPQVSWRTTNFDFAIYDEHSNNFVSSYGNNDFLYFAYEACKFSPNPASSYWTPDGKVIRAFTLTHPEIPTLTGTITATFEYIATSSPPKMKLTFSCDRPALFTPGALGYIEISVSSMPEWDFDTYHPVVTDGNGAVLSAISEIFTSSTQNGGDLKYSRFRVELPAFPKGAALRYVPDKVGLTGAANFNLGSRSSVDVVDARSATQTGFIDFVAGTANFGNGLITDLSTCIGGPDFDPSSLTGSGLVLTSPTNVPRAIGPLLEQLQVDTQTMVWEWQQDSLAGSPTIFRASNADESGGVDSYIFDGHFFVSEWYGDFNSIGGSFATGPMKAAITVDDFGWTGAINGSPAIYSMPNTKYTLTNWMIGNVILSGYDPLGGTLKKITFYTPGNATDTQNLSSQ